DSPHPIKNACAGLRVNEVIGGRAGRAVLPPCGQKELALGRSQSQIESKNTATLRLAFDLDL
ncbi:MAG: hypothetical protein HW378_4238, partial [Anaerolineales bacterium]|nr:hypothetical protein [Anaerolineales bacterium]